MSTTTDCKWNPSIARIAMLAVTAFVFMNSAELQAAAQTSVTTYHYDNYRTGWNQKESVLTPSNVASPSFGLLHQVQLDDQVDAQPLVVPGVAIAGGTHDVVYVVTEKNTVYAINVHTGMPLVSVNLGTAVPLPLGCNNNANNVGITSTPVIDPSSNTMYVVAYTLENNSQVYRLHALDLGTLTDKLPSAVVSAQHTLTNGTVFSFNAQYQRQRPALLLANGGIYVGFGSFCDFSANLSRGWLLGWTAATLTPFPSSQLNDQQATDSGNFFLSSIWMSGYGPATDDSGNILFVTGNSDARTYDGITNLQESVVKISNTLTAVIDLFTPRNQVSLDNADADFGSGGVMVLPDQPGSTPHLAVAAGKNGTMFLLNEDNLGHYSPKKNNVLASYSIGGCWCGESYYMDPKDGLGRVVSSGGSTVEVWKVETKIKPALKKAASSAFIGGGQDPGFFTSISSNGSTNPIIWALSRPSGSGNNISLFAFDPETGGSTLKQLFQASAGTWPYLGGNANLVPVVANGQVFVASYKQLSIFGLTNGVTNGLSSVTKPKATKAANQQ